MELFAPMHLLVLGILFSPIVAIIGGIWAVVHFARLRADQRMAILARGHTPAEIEALLKAEENVYASSKRTKDPMRSLGNARRAAVVLISLGVGTILFFLAVDVVLHLRPALAGAATGLIPLVLGLGFVVDYHLQKRELSRFGLELDPDRNSPKQ